MKKCPKCGHEGEHTFCPECGTKMIDAQTEEERKGEIFERAAKRLEERTSESYKQAIKELEELGDWRDADKVVEECKEKLTEIEKIEAEQKAESERAALYERALKKFEQKTSKEYKSGIADLEKLEDYRDAAKIVEERKAELEDIEKEEKKKKKKIKMIIIIAAAAIAAIIIGVSVIKSVTTPNLADYSVTKDAKLNSMSYKIPEECKLEDGSNDTFVQYSLSKNDNVIGVIEVEYRGDSDLSGDVGFDAETAEHKTTDSALALIPEASGTYQDVEADNSVFEVTVYCNEDKVKGGSELLSNIADSFDVDGYKNPRTIESVDFSYDGETSADTVIDSDSEGVTVTATIKTALGTAEKSLDWEIKEPVTLKADTTSKVKITAGEYEKELKVECSTISEKAFKEKCKTRNYKDLLRNDSEGEFIKIHGKVLQDCGNKTFRISSSGAYDDVFFVRFPPRNKIYSECDLVEDDWVTIYGYTNGVYTYTTVLGASQSIPEISVRYFER